MLPIGVESDDKVGALSQRKRNAGLQRRALAQVDRMSDDGCACLHGQIGGGVGRAVVDDDDLMSGAAQVGQNTGDRLRFVECGDDHPSAAAARYGTSCHDPETSRGLACSKQLRGNPIGSKNRTLSVAELTQALDTASAARARQLHGSPLRERRFNMSGVPSSDQVARAPQHRYRDRGSQRS